MSAHCLVLDDGSECLEAAGISVADLHARLDEVDGVAEGDADPAWKS